MIELDGQALAPETASAPIPVDAGAHRVTAKLENGRSWATYISLGACAANRDRSAARRLGRGTGDRDHPGLPVSTTRGPGARGRAGGARNEAGGREAAATNDDASGGPVWALGLAIAGAGAVLAGSALFVSARLQYDAAHEHCTADNVCPSRGMKRKRMRSAVPGFRQPFWLPGWPQAASARCCISPMAEATLHREPPRCLGLWVQGLDGRVSRYLVKGAQ